MPNIATNADIRSAKMTGNYAYFGGLITAKQHRLCANLSTYRHSKSADKLRQKLNTTAEITRIIKQKKQEFWLFIKPRFAAKKCAT